MRGENIFFFCFYFFWGGACLFNAFCFFLIACLFVCAFFLLVYFFLCLKQKAWEEIMDTVTSFCLFFPFLIRLLFCLFQNFRIRMRVFL